jgi:hypothetical protein
MTGADMAVIEDQSVVPPPETLKLEVGLKNSLNDRMILEY